jgi:GABA permease
MTYHKGHQMSDDTATSEIGRSLKSRHVEMIAIGGIIGAGLFVGSSTSIATVGPAVVISYLLAGLVILCVMRMLSEMAIAQPGIGAFTEFTRSGLGPLAGFVSGWLYWYFWAVVVAFEAIAGAKIIVILFPALPLAIWQIGVMLLALMTVVNLMSARSFGEFEYWFSLLKVCAIVGFILIAGAFAFGLTAPNGATFANLTAHGGFAPAGPLAVLGGVTSVIFALCGAEIATIAAAESAEPRRTIARLTGSVTLRILIFYVISVLLIVSVVPWTAIRPGESPFATALDAMQVPYAATIMNIVVLIAVLSCLNSGIYVTSRILFNLAARGDAPKALVALNARKVPAMAIYTGSVVALIAVLTSVISADRVFSFLLNALGAIMLIIYLIVAAAQIALRRRFERENPAALQIKMWFFPYASYAVIAAILAILAAMAASPTLADELYSSLAVLAVIYVAFLMRRARAAL